MRAEPFGRSLVALQAALYDLITAPEGVARRLGELDGSPADLEALVKPSPAMTAVERLDVYANMYFYRILDVLRVEYARVVAAVGDAEFHNAPGSSSWLGSNGRISSSTTVPMPLR